MSASTIPPSSPPTITEAERACVLADTAMESICGMAQGVRYPLSEMNLRPDNAEAYEIHALTLGVLHAIAVVAADASVKLEAVQQVLLYELRREGCTCDPTKLGNGD